MGRMACNPRFVNKAGNDLVSGKIHTIRQNYKYWEKFEGRDVELFTWEEKPYRSKQKVFCVKRIVSVQVTVFDAKAHMFWISTLGGSRYCQNGEMAYNDGFSSAGDFADWFKFSPTGIMAIVHFTDFRYGAKNETCKATGQLSIFERPQ
jgi:hypothetical protein